MRIEQIDMNKIRVFITNDDMERMNIDTQNLSPDSPELSKCLFKIIEYVKNQTGFNPGSEKMIIEAVQSIDGLMLMLTRSDDMNIKKPTKQTNRKLKNLKVKKKSSLPKYSIYEFLSVLDFFNAIKSAKEEWLEYSSVYRLNNKYYIVSEIEDRMYKAFLSEFASGCCYDKIFGSFLNEHAEFVAKGGDLVYMAGEIHNFY